MLLLPVAVNRASADSASWAVPSARLRLTLDLETGTPWPAIAGQASVCAGALNPEKTRITVVAPDGRTLNSSILWARAGQPLLLAFDTASGITSCTAYLEAGSPRARNAWLPQAGILLETRSLDRPAFDSRADFDKAWNAASRIWGRSFRNQVFDGIHPHGPGERVLARYEGWFRVKEPGNHAFATLSDDASFFDVDSRPVAEWPGIHSAAGGRYGEKKGSLNLQPGVHRFRYDYAQDGGVMTALASWKPPGQKHFVLMPPESFPPIARFSCRAAESAPNRPTAHFGWRVARSIRLDQAVLVAIAFRAMPVAEAAYAWKFGDGTRAEGESVEHVYIGPSPRQVRLEMRSPKAATLAITQSVDAHPAWWQIEECPDSALAPLRAAVQSRNPASLSLPELEITAAFASALKDRGWLDQAGSECLRRNTGFSPSFAPVLVEIGLNFRHALFRKYAESDAMLGLALTAASRLDDAALGARITLALVENRLNGLRRPESALRLLNDLQEEGLDAPASRQKKLLTVDTLMALGRPEEARRLGRALPPVEIGSMGTLHRQARLATAADFVRRAEWDAAVDRLLGIMRDFPTERFSGGTGLLLMDALAGRNETAPALALGERLLHAEILDDDRANVLLRLSRLHRARGETSSADHYRDRLKNEFPYSEAAAAAGS